MHIHIHSIELTTPLDLSVSGTSKNGEFHQYHYLCKARALLAKLPGMCMCVCVCVCVCMCMCMCICVCACVCVYVWCVYVYVYVHVYVYVYVYVYVCMYVLPGA